MKKIALMTLLALLLFSCQNDKKKVEKEVKDESTSKTTQIDDTEKTEKIFNEFVILYNELLSFKDDAKFKEYGFGIGGPYNEGLVKTQKLSKNKDSKLLLNKGVVAGELEQLGLAYVTSEGKETETTEFFNKVFSEAISPIEVEEIETASGKSNYNNLKDNYELFGKWEIENTLVKDSYPYEIYIKNSEYIGVIPQGDYKTDILEKKGDNYFVKGNKYGEYFKIDSKMNMTLFDRDGDLSSMGYKTIRQK
ncbi:MAG: hypothetical protein PHE33_04040 [Bacteroidales bacterium]|nr:hypothetical protein [Bacteroidales bacterium]